MSLALARATAPLIAQMEADDRRPNPRAFALMVDALRANGWDGCCSDARPFGATGRMSAYCDWQNNLTRPAALAANLFVEIPALHQAGVFTRRPSTPFWRRRGAATGTARRRPLRRTAPSSSLDVPVDLWWWLEFFARARAAACGRRRAKSASAVWFMSRRWRGATEI